MRSNDIAFLRNFRSRHEVKMLFAIYAGIETELLEKNVGERRSSTSSPMCRPRTDYPVNFGMYHEEYKARLGEEISMAKIEFGFMPQPDTHGADPREDFGSTASDQLELPPRRVQPVRRAQDAGRHLRTR